MKVVPTGNQIPVIIVVVIVIIIIFGVLLHWKFIPEAVWRTRHCMLWISSQHIISVRSEGQRPQATMLMIKIKALSELI